jgi:hypothetical protein
MSTGSHHVAWATPPSQATLASMPVANRLDRAGLAGSSARTPEIYDGVNLADRPGLLRPSQGRPEWMAGSGFLPWGRIDPVSADVTNPPELANRPRGFVVNAEGAAVKIRP